MPITWQSVSAPNFGASNSLFNQSANRITDAFERGAQQAKQVDLDQKADNLKAFQKRATDMAMNPDINDKQLLGEVLRYGNDNDINQADSLAQVAQLKALRDTMAENTAEQNQVIGALDNQYQLLQTKGAEDIEKNLANYDQIKQAEPQWSKYSEYEAGLNPSVAIRDMLTAADDFDLLNFFGLPGDFANSTGGAQLEGRVHDLLNATNKDGTPRYSGIAIQAAVEEMVNRDGEINTKIFQDSLDRHQKEVGRFEQHARDRVEDRRKQEAALQNQLAQLLDQRAETQNQFTRDNIKYFTGG